VGIDAGDEQLAVMNSLVSAAGVVASEIDGRPVTVWHASGTASPLNDQQVAGGDDIGAIGVFFADAGDGPLTFHRTAYGFVDDQTGSTWNILGEATAGPLTGTELEPVRHLDTFWFAWSTEHPDSAVLE
jgi:hypothetical protein